MDISFIPAFIAQRLHLAIVVLALLAFAFAINLRRPSLPKNIPPLINGLPIIGSWSFFTHRWDFYQQALARTKGNFSFWAGTYPVIGLRGEQARSTFFESKELNMSEGYRTMLGGSPADRDDPIDTDYFSKRIVNMLKGGALRKNLPQLVNDTRKHLDRLESDPSGITKPFDSIYEIVFQLTMRAVGCSEIANDQQLLHKVLSYFEVIEACGDKPLAVMFPGLWTLDKAKQTIAGFKLYRTIDKIVKARSENDHKEQDAMQYLLDQGDSSLNIVKFIVGALFAGQLNSGINAGWMVVHLSRNKYWRDRVVEEIRSVVNKYMPDSDEPLREKLARLPIEAWESDFPILDLCLKDNIRLNLNGTAFRRNIADYNLNIDQSGDVIPAKAFAVYHVGQIHLNPDIYPDPYTWDPARYLPDRAEDQKQKLAWIGWGVGRHPCLGMRFAKLEMNMIIAFWFAYFESELVDHNGRATDVLPINNVNANTAKKPSPDCYVKYWTRKH